MIKKSKYVMAYFQGESTPRIGELYKLARNADPEWIRGRLDVLRPEDAKLDPATFNEVRRALLTDLCEE